MRNNRRTGVLALATSLALAAGVVTVVLPAAANGPTEYIEGGTLTLTTATTGTANSVSYSGTEYVGPNQNLATTTLTGPGASGCDLADPTAGPLLTFKAYLGAPSTTQPALPPTVGFKGGSIGVNEEIDALCSRVDATSRTGKTEYLDVALSDKLVNYGGKQLLAKSAALDIEVKQSGLFNTTKARIEATALLGGNAKGTFTLIQGKAPSTPAPNTTYCNVGDTKNCQWQIAAPVDADGKPAYYFDTLRLKAVSAGFSLEGGSDGASDAGALSTTFDLVSVVDKEFTCTAGESLTNADGTKVTYVGNAGADECENFGVVLESSAQQVRFLKPLGVTPDAQFLFDVEWTQEIAGPGATVPTVTIDFENYAVPTTTPIVSDMAFCPEALYDGEGALVGVQEADDFAAIEDWRDDLLGTQYACLDQPRSVEISGATLTVTDRVFLIGDARMRLG